MLITLTTKGFKLVLESRDTNIRLYNTALDQILHKANVITKQEEIIICKCLTIDCNASAGAIIPNRAKPHQKSLLLPVQKHAATAIAPIPYPSLYYQTLS